MGMKKLTKHQQQVWTVLSTPTDVDFKKFREEHDTFWLTKEREYIYIQDMTLDHLVSCINMLERCNQDYTKAYEGLTKELNRRYIAHQRSMYEN